MTPHLQESPPTIAEVCDFLCAYASALLQYGAYTSRVIKCTNRIGRSFGYDVYISVFLQYITMNIADSKNNRRTQIIKNTHIGMHLSIISNLSALSWEICDERISLQEARERFHHICAHNPPSIVIGAILVPLGNATFCKLFDGDFGALLCIFIGTLVGYFLRHFFMKIHLDNRAQLVLVSFCVSFVAYIGVWLGLSQTPAVAIGGSILYLIPGALILNAFVDIIHENTLMGISRLVNMMVLMICIASGVYGTIAITNINVL